MLKIDRKIIETLKSFPELRLEKKPSELCQIFSIRNDALCRVLNRLERSGKLKVERTEGGGFRRGNVKSISLLSLPGKLTSLGKDKRMGRWVPTMKPQELEYKILEGLRQLGGVCDEKVAIFADLIEVSRFSLYGKLWQLEKQGKIMLEKSKSGRFIKKIILCEEKAGLPVETLSHKLGTTSELESYAVLQQELIQVHQMLAEKSRLLEAKDGLIERLKIENEELESELKVYRKDVALKEQELLDSQNALRAARVASGYRSKIEDLRNLG